MEASRRSFIRGILALTAIAATAPGMELLAGEAAPTKKGGQQPQKKPSLPGLWYDRRLLIDSFFPMLEMNEKEVLHFYRDTKKKITVGYGSNVQANPSLLSNVTIYHKKKKLTPEEKKVFLSTMASKSKSDLSNYHISQDDAKKMATTTMDQFLTSLSTTFTNPKTKKSFFFELPLCMQALCLDIIYNVGSDGFAKFVKFKKAITARDFSTATKESLVYTDVKNKKFNKNRERLKKRLIRIMKIVQDNFQKKSPQIFASLQADYRAQVPLKIRLLRGPKECRSEALLAEGELTHIRLHQMRTQANAKSSPITVCKSAPPTKEAKLSLAPKRHTIGRDV